MKLNWTASDRYLSKYRRELVERQENRIKFLLLMLFFTILVFVIFGIRPLAKRAVEVKGIYDNLTDAKIKLESKISTIDENKAIASRYTYKIDLLNKKIPESAQLQNYLEEVVIASSNSGFIVKRLLVAESYEDRAILEILFTGSNTNITQLIGILEETYRYATIHSVKTVSDDGEIEVRVNLELYFGGNK